jgi:hypothetical protein
MPDGKRLVSVSKDRTVRIWDLTTGAELAVLMGHTGLINGVAVTPDGAKIVTASNDQTARIWDARTGAQLRLLKGHETFVYGVAVSPDGGRVATGSGDKTARVWDIETGDELAVLRGHTNWVYSVAITPDGNRIVTTSGDRTARVWDFFPSGQALVRQSKARTPRCLAAEERERFHLPPAVPQWCEAMNKWPFSVAALVIDGEEHLAAKDYDKAIAAFTAAIERDPGLKAEVAPQLATALNRRAWMLLLDGRFEQGLIDAERAVALAPDNADILDTRGQLYLALRRMDAAFTDLDKAIAGGIAAPATYVGRGRCYEARGDSRAAAADYRKALELEPDEAFDRSAQEQARARLAALDGDRK